FLLVKGLTEDYLQHVRPRQAELADSLQAAMRTYSRGLMELFPEKTWWPDANSTLRLSYGRVEGAAPRDGMRYEPFTTLDGVMAKADPANPDFEVPAKLKE